MHRIAAGGSQTQEFKTSFDKACIASLVAFANTRGGTVWVPHVQVSDLQAGTLKRFREQAIHSQRLPETIREESDQLPLERLRLTKDGYLKRAAALLFHPEPDRYVTGATIKIGAFGQSDADLIHQDEITGNLFTQVGTAIEVLKLKYFKVRISYDGLYRKERYPLSMAALREAILNAAVHKDYASHVAIQISVYPDKLMIWNPGQLPDVWTLEKLLGKHASHPFNPDIANAFFRAGLIESWGRGIERITAACGQEAYPAPEWVLEPGGLWVTFTYASDHVGQEAGEIEPTDPQVTPQVEQLLLILQGASTRDALMQQLGLKDREHFRGSYLTSALSAGLVEMTLPHKPTSRLQQYRLTEAGQRVQAGLSRQRIRAT